MTLLSDDHLTSALHVEGFGHQCQAEIEWSSLGSGNARFSSEFWIRNVNISERRVCYDLSAGTVEDSMMSCRSSYIWMLPASGWRSGPAAVFLGAIFASPHSPRRFRGSTCLGLHSEPCLSAGSSIHGEGELPGTGFGETIGPPTRSGLCKPWLIYSVFKATPIGIFDAKCASLVNGQWRFVDGANRS